MIYFLVPCRVFTDAICSVAMHSGDSACFRICRAERPPRGSILNHFAQTIRDAGRRIRDDFARECLPIFYDEDIHSEVSFRASAVVHAE